MMPLSGDSARATAIVLAGGRSSRMGTPKALLPFGGRPLVAHITAALQRLFDDIVIVAAEQQDLPPLPGRVVRDAVAHQGPVGGLVYGLAAARHELCFATSCDAAFLQAELIAFLLVEASEHDVVVPQWEGRLQPLHAVYRRSVLALLEAQLARGELRPVYLFDKVRTRVVDEAEVRQRDPEGLSFINMNTPDEYQRALAKLRSRTADP